MGVTKKLFQTQEILYRTKFGKNKANFAENAILTVKRKLYMLLRGTLSQDWVKALPKVTDSLNNTPLKKLGWLTPNSIHSEIDSVRVQSAKKSFQIPSYSEPDYRTQRTNQETYEKSKGFQVKDFVYLNFKEKIFDKSFDVSVSNLESLL